VIKLSDLWGAEEGKKSFVEVVKMAGGCRGTGRFGGTGAAVVLVAAVLPQEQLQLLRRQPRLVLLLIRWSSPSFPNK
jgi:hypothetical protein